MDRMRWRDLVASTKGPSSPTTRLVLLVLSLNMDKSGKAWPAIDLLAERSGLSEKAVRTNLQRAEREGWITRRHRSSGKGWRHYVYAICVPGGLEGAERRTGGNDRKVRNDVPEETADGAVPRSLGAVPDDHLVRYEVPTNPLLREPVNEPVFVASLAKQPTDEPNAVQEEEANRQDDSQTIVACLDTLLKANDLPGVTEWGAARKMARSRLKQASAAELTAALKWGFTRDFWKRKLLAHGMKVVGDLWADWKIQTPAAGSSEPRFLTEPNDGDYAAFADQLQRQVNEP